MTSLLGMNAIITSTAIVLGASLIGIFWSYAKGLGDSPRDLWLVTGARVLEGVAYFAIIFSTALWLSTDVGLGDVEAGWFISAWYVMKAVFGLFSGPFIDRYGIRKSLIASFLFLLISRVFIVGVTDPALVVLLVFLPSAIGAALLEPVSLIAIKRYTNAKSAGLAFGMIYVAMNIAMSAGLFAFDNVRAAFGEHGGTSVALVGHLSTYQFLFMVGLLITAGGFVFVLFTRQASSEPPCDVAAASSHERVGNGGLVQALSDAFKSVGHGMSAVMREPYFWKFVFIISLTLFTRSTFFHLLYLFPKYGVRVLGEGAQVGTIYGVLNPLLITILVPLAAIVTRNISSYSCLIVGTAISSLAVFIAAIPEGMFSPLTASALGEIVFVQWLGIASDAQALISAPPSSLYWPLCLFIVIWSLGESVWYPRLIQLMTELAPRGSEGTYLGFVGLTSYVPNLLAGPMSGLLLAAYVPMIDKVGVDGAAFSAVGDTSRHYMIWIWIGAVAVLTPIALIAFKRIYDSMAKVNVAD